MLDDRAILEDELLELLDVFDTVAAQAIDRPRAERPRRIADDGQHRGVVSVERHGRVHVIGVHGFVSGHDDLLERHLRGDADAERLDRIDGVEALICDVTDDAQVARLRAAVDARADGLWGIVHNAGIAHLGPLATTSLDDMRAVFEVNVFGVHRVTNALSDLIVASRGRLVTMSSIAGTLSSTPLGTYAMTKHALEAYTDSLAKQLAPLGVHVCAVVPGNFASALARNAVERFAPPADASEELKASCAPDADTSRSEFPSPAPVAAACHAALFDEAPLTRYLVVPIAEEADRTLEQAAHEWARLNASTPHRWSTERLVAELDTDRSSTPGPSGTTDRRA